MPEEPTCADTLAVREERAADAQGKAQLAALEEKVEAVGGGEVAVNGGGEAQRMNTERVENGGDEDGGNHGGDSDDQLDATQLAGDRTSQHPQLQEARAKEKGKEDENKGQLGAGSGGRAKVGAGGAGIKVAMLPGCCC
jgi:hypothetical protein